MHGNIANQHGNVATTPRPSTGSATVCGITAKAAAPPVFAMQFESAVLATARRRVITPGVVGGGATPEMLKPLRVRHHLGLMQARGIAAAPLLKGTGIDATRFADPAYLVSIDQCHRVVANMIRLSGNDGIGLDVGLHTHLTDLGVVGYAMAASSTLGQAIGLWMQFGNSRVGFPFVMKGIEDKSRADHWGMSATPSGLSSAVFRFYVEETIAMGAGLAPLLTGAPLQYKVMHFAYPAPAYRRRYDELFQCPVHFDASQTFAIVRSPSLERPVIGSDDDLRELCIRHCSLLASQSSRSGPITTRLRNMLKARGTIPSLKSAAEALSISPRSLSRHLQAEGRGYQAVLDEFRCDLAKEYLGAGIQAKEAAYLLGFSHVDTFRQAFKQWTGVTVGQYQRAPGADGPMLRALQ
jgi:AraC-like DNA-binding protein